MPRKILISSTKGVIILLSIVGGINISVSVTTLAPVFSTISTSLAPNPAPGLPTSAGGGDSGVNGILQPLQEFVAPYGYDQAREDPSYAIVIPFSDLGASPFEPASISIPANMSVIWFNEDVSQHSVTFNDTSPEAIDSGPLAQGDVFIHKFSIPGIYDYYDSQNPTSKGRINVGSEFESGQNMVMLVGGNALPFEAGKIGRTPFHLFP
jgi:plastocyanin